MQEILKRHAQGLSWQDGKVPVYDGEDPEDELEGVDPRTLDISERHDIVESRRQELARLKQELNDKAKKNEVKKAAAQIKKEAQEEAKKTPPPTTPPKTDDSTP